MRKNTLKLATLILGYAFLYIPIFTLIVFSFNSSKQVVVWAGFSLKWYGELFENTELLNAAWISLRIAFMCATFSVILGTLSALILVKFKRFRGKNLFQTLIMAPLVMPEIITGLAFLLLFVNMERLIGWPASGGITALTIAHTTLAMAYVTSIVYSQLVNFDDILIEAAMDLGASPLKSFFAITLPIITPSLVAGWLLSFVLSLDDVVISSFVAGPQSTTLPMVVYSSVKYGLTPQINALATIIISFIALCIIIAAILHARHQKMVNQN